MVFKRIVTVEPGANHLLEIEDGRRAILLLEAFLKVIPELFRSWLQEVRVGSFISTGASRFSHFVPFELIELN